MSLKSGVLFSLFSGVSFADLQRAATHRDPARKAGSPSAADIAHATRFAGPSQVSVDASETVDLKAAELARLRLAA